jgi:hypothetical protein
MLGERQGDKVTVSNWIGIAAAVLLAIIAVEGAMIVQAVDRNGSNVQSAIISTACGAGGSFQSNPCQIRGDVFVRN